MSRATDSDAHLLEVLGAAKAKLNALNEEIQFAQQDNEVYKKLAEQTEGEKAAVEARTNELKEELKAIQDHNKETSDRCTDLKTAIGQTKQELATIIENGEQKYKDIAGHMKMSQSEQKKIQQQYKELQKDSDRLDKEKEKMMRLQESLERKNEEIEAYRQELEAHQARDSDRIQSLGENAKIMKDLSTHSPSQ